MTINGLNSGLNITMFLSKIQCLDFLYLAGLVIHIAGYFVMFDVMLSNVGYYVM